MMEIGVSVNDTMTNRKIWFITGASRGMGVDFVKAAWPPATRWWHRSGP